MVTRREFLAGNTAVMLAGCLPEGPVPSSVRNPPWLMWGNSITQKLTWQGLGAVQQQTTQLVRIAYGRPENWTWLFEATLLTLNNANGGTFQVGFDLTVGLGRTSTTIQNFEFYQNTWIAGAAIVPYQWYSNTVIGPGRAGKADLRENILRNICAQDIQLTARFSYLSIHAGDTCEAEISAYFSPVSHIRPEWFKGNMNAGEDSGR